MSIGKGLIAFLLPLTFLGSYAACSLSCGEIAERHEEYSFSLVGHPGESCLSDFDSESCPIKSIVAVVEGRQTIVYPDLAIQNINSFQLDEFSFVPVSIYPADLNQNSPPRASSDPPIFLRHCAFRI